MQMVVFAVIGGSLRALLRKGFGDGVGKRRQVRNGGNQLADMLIERVMQNAGNRIVARDETEVRVEYHHAGRHVGQYRFQIGLCIFQRDAVPFDRSARIGQLPGHHVERFRQRAQFIRCGNNRPW